jgi:hypothetical protein
MLPVPRIYLLSSIYVTAPGTSYILIRWVIYCTIWLLQSYDIQINDATSVSEVIVLELHVRMIMSGK